MERFSPTLRDTIDFIEIASTQQVMQLTLVIWLQQIEKECLVLVLQRVFMVEDFNPTTVIQSVQIASLR